ncbi:hypothetical protein PG999_011031 [Apiospora kogelbergensis]|uniref:Uncharacterized protein n=1 Tax=Apiospora kogelbergensis TaxID=1337665 RepID=A0AAW0QDT0_9PEZI
MATLTPARTLSFSGSESDAMVQSGMLSFEHSYEETSQPDDSPVTSVSDISESRFSTVDFGRQDKHDSRHEAITPAECEGSVEESVESDTPTPRIETPADSCMSLRPSRSMLGRPEKIGEMAVLRELSGGQALNWGAYKSHCKTQ